MERWGIFDGEGTIMPAVSSKVSRVLRLGGANRRALMECVDHLGKTWEHRPPGIDGDDFEAVLAAWVAKIDDIAKAWESHKVERYTLNGGSPGDYTRLYLTAQEWATVVIKTMMQVDDPLAVMPTAEYIDASVTNTQLQNFFGTAKGTRIRNRVNKMILNKTAFEEDRAAVEEL